MKRNHLAFLLIFFCLNLLQAQRNYKFENFGNRSILLNGNVTGSVDDLGATYYNPARLALVEEPVFSINAKIYQLTDLKIDNITIDGKDISTSNFDGIPSMVAGTFKLKFLEGHQFAYSLFSRNRSDFSLGYHTDLIIGEDEEENPIPLNYVGKTTITNKLREYWYGISWAKSLNPNFSLGASLFFSTYNFNGGLIQQFNAIDENDQVSIYNFTTSFQQKSYGLFGKIAAAWILPKVELGLNIDIPYIEITGDGKYSYEEYLSSFDNENNIFTFNNFEDLDSKRKYPLGISVGAGIPIKKHKLHLNISWNAKTNQYDKIDIPPLESETEEELPIVLFNEELKSTFNFGFGAEIYIVEKLNAYGSFSTDFSPFVTSASILDTANQTGEKINFETNYSHFGFGVNVSHKWANFVLGTVYSRGKSNIVKPLTVPGSSSNEDETSTIFINRWRFLIGIEVLFLDKAMSKHGIDKKLIIQ